MSASNQHYEPVNYAISLEPMTCGTCGGAYALSREFMEHCRKVGRAGGATWRCPYCKGPEIWSYGSSEVERLRRKLESAEQREQFAERRLAAERARVRDVERSRAAYKAQSTKLRKRVGNGVCPCCNRTFTQLARHMTAKHPEFAAPA